MQDASSYRTMAERCRKLAATITKREVALQLEKWASDYDEEAAKAELHKTSANEPPAQAT